MCAVEPLKDVNLGANTELRVYVDGDPALRTEEIVWHTPLGPVNASDPRTSLHDSNTRLVIRNVGLGDSGTYQISIVREITFAVYQTVASTTIDLNVHGELAE